MRSERGEVIEHVNCVFFFFFVFPEIAHSILVYSYIGQDYCMIGILAADKPGIYKYRNYLGFFLRDPKKHSSKKLNSDILKEALL